jgi:hypothetical protein
MATLRAMEEVIIPIMVVFSKFLATNLRLKLRIGKQ